MAELMDAGKLTVRVGAILPLAEARHAHEMIVLQCPDAHADVSPARS